MSLIAGAGFALGAAVGLFWWAPQLLRVVRVSSIGVSAATWALFAASAGVWSVWAAFDGQWGLAMVNFVETAGVVAVVSVLRAWRSLAYLGALIAATFVLASAVAPEAVVVVGFVVTVGSRVPQIIAVRTTERVAGVSWRSWMISVAGNSGWAVWAALDGVWPFFVTTIAALTMSAVIAVSTYTRQRSAR